jgi:predicted nucleic acid-binding protein
VPGRAGAARAQTPPVHCCRSANIWRRDMVGELYAVLGRKGTPIGPNNGHALTLGVTLVTNNDRHFSQVAGLQLEDWR